MFLMDREFEYIYASLHEEANSNTTATSDHVTDIEHKNRIIK